MNSFFTEPHIAKALHHVMSIRNYILPNVQFRFSYEQEEKNRFRKVNRIRSVVDVASAADKMINQICSDALHVKCVPWTFPTNANEMYQYFMLSMEQLKCPCPTWTSTSTSTSQPHRNSSERCAVCLLKLNKFYDFIHWNRSLSLGTLSGCERLCVCALMVPGSMHGTACSTWLLFCITAHVWHSGG